MEVVRMESAAKTTTARGITSRKLVDRPAVQVMNLLLEPGEEVPAHVTPVDVLFYTVKGQGTIAVGEEKVAAGPTDIVVSPKGVPHTLKADCGEEFSVLVIKTPNPKP